MKRSLPDFLDYFHLFFGRVCGACEVCVCCVWGSRVFLRSLSAAVACWSNDVVWYCSMYYITFPQQLLNRLQCYQNGLRAEEHCDHS